MLASESWQLVAKTDDYALAGWQQVFCVIWRAETTLEGVAQLQASCTAFAAKRPAGIGLLTIIESAASLPPSASRKAIAAFFEEASSFIKCSAVVFEGAGFRAAAVRSVVTGLTLMARQKFPHRVCDMAEAVQMFSSILPDATRQPVSPAALRASFAELRRRLAA